MTIDNLEEQQDDVYQQNNEEEVRTLQEHHPEVEQILEKLEPEEKEIISTMISYSGPLPPPEYLRGYAEVYPEAPEKIFGWVDEQQAHRQTMDKEILNKSFKQSTYGLFCGLAVVLTFIILGFVLILMDKEAAGFTMMMPVVLTLGGYFILQRKKEEPQNSENNKDEQG